MAERRNLHDEVIAVESKWNIGDKIKAALELMKNPPPLMPPPTEGDLEKSFKDRFGVPFMSYNNGLAKWFERTNPAASNIGFPHGPLAVMDREEGVRAAMPYGGYYGKGGRNPYARYYNRGDKLLDRLKR